MKKNIDVLDKGCLVRFTASVWGGQIKMPSSMLDVEEEGADASFISAHKSLVEKSVLKPIEQVRNAAKGYLYDKTLPFPISGILFIPKDMIGEVDDRLREYQEQFFDEVDEFVDKYDIFIRRAKEKLGGLFNPTEYPLNIRDKFNLEWGFYMISTPGKAGILSPEIYEREQAKFEGEMRLFRETAVTALRQKFVEMVERLTDKLNGGGVFRDTTVNNLKGFLNDFSKLNVNDDQALEILIEKAKGVIDSKVEARDLRIEGDFRKAVADKMLGVQKAMKGSILDQRGVLLSAV